MSINEVMTAKNPKMVLIGIVHKSTMLIKGEKILTREKAKIITGVTIIEAAKEALRSSLNILGSIFTYLFTILLTAVEYNNKPKVAPDDRIKL